MKLLVLGLVVSLSGAGYWYLHSDTASISDTVATIDAVRLQGPLPTQTSLAVTPRSRFTPSTRKGYYSLDIVSDFTLPATKTITFCGRDETYMYSRTGPKFFGVAFQPSIRAEWWRAAKYGKMVFHPTAGKVLFSPASGHGFFTKGILEILLV